MLRVYNPTKYLLRLALFGFCLLSHFPPSSLLSLRSCLLVLSNTTQKKCIIAPTSILVCIATRTATLEWLVSLSLSLISWLVPKLHKIIYMYTRKIGYRIFALSGYHVFL